MTRVEGNVADTGTCVITTSSCSETVGNCVGGVRGCCDELASPCGVVGACDMTASLSEAGRSHTVLQYSLFALRPFPLVGAAQGGAGVRRFPVPFPVVLGCIGTMGAFARAVVRKLGLFLRLKRGCGYTCTRNTTNMHARTNYNKIGQLENGFELALRFSFCLLGISDSQRFLKRLADFLTRFTDLR